MIRCPYCGGGTTTTNDYCTELLSSDITIMLKNVPTISCEECDCRERFYSVEVMKKINSIIDQVLADCIMRETKTVNYDDYCQ